MSDEDYIFLTKYVENAKNGFPNNKMLILYGNEERNYRSSLIEKIKKYIGETNYQYSDHLGSAFFESIRKLVIISTDSIDNYTNRKLIQQLINVIQYNQSIIAITNNIENIDASILENSYSIPIFHIL
jgi:hypothetical protein